MFVPPLYHAPDESWIVEVVRGNPLAQLISNGPDGDAPYVTHVPVILDPAIDEEPHDLVGATLWGHLNRANPHWAALQGTTPAVITFTGPHAYVSPTLYGSSPAAPTWDFTAVHVRGRLTVEEQDDDTLDTVRATVRAFEGRFGQGWDMTDSLDYFRRILPGVGAFRLQVTDVEAMFKLSQEQEPQTRGRVRADFAERPGCRHQEVAGLMARLE